jgi:hypothetical protein
MEPISERALDETAKKSLFADTRKHRDQNEFVNRTARERRYELLMDLMH